ncbi:MAG: acyl-CoA dehydrogenase family protein [Anaerovoracaceae bacterium]
MNFTKEHELVRKLAREFAETELKTLAEEIDKTNEFPQDVLKKMFDAGFMGIKMPVEFGGAGADYKAYAIVMEEFARVCAVAAIYISSVNSLNSAPILNDGTDEQKEKFLRPMISGDKFFCFALTEPGAGSDAASLLTTAVEDGDDYILNGRKCFITAAPFSDYMIVFAKTAPKLGVKGITTFVVDSHAEGVSFGKAEEKMGIKGCATSDIVLENVRVPKANILGNINEGFTNAMKTLKVGRLGIAAQALGIATGAMEEAVSYVKARKQFGKKISQFQNTQFTIAEMHTKLTAMQHLVYDAADRMDKGLPADQAASMAKLYTAEEGKWIVDRALQFHGGYGYIKEYPIERMYRDIRICSLYEGTSEVQKMVIAGPILK